jgi:hypothetical protein
MLMVYCSGFGSINYPKFLAYYMGLLNPTAAPSLAPSLVPSTAPSHAPSCEPTIAPTVFSTTSVPSASPTLPPTTTPQPSAHPSLAPSFALGYPTPEPSRHPTLIPSKGPTPIPSTAPTSMPTIPLPTVTPTPSPTSSPSPNPTYVPTVAPSITPGSTIFSFNVTSLQLSGVSATSILGDPHGITVLQATLATVMNLASVSYVTNVHITAQPGSRLRLLRSGDAQATDSVALSSFTSETLHSGVSCSIAYPVAPSTSASSTPSAAVNAAIVALQTTVFNGGFTTALHTQATAYATSSYFAAATAPQQAVSVTSPVVVAVTATFSPTVAPTLSPTVPAAAITTPAGDSSTSVSTYVIIGVAVGGLGLLVCVGALARWLCGSSVRSAPARRNEYEVKAVPVHADSNIAMGQIYDAQEHLAERYKAAACVTIPVSDVVSPRRRN